MNILLLLSSLVGLTFNVTVCEPFLESCFQSIYYTLLKLDLCSNELGGLGFSWLGRDLWGMRP